MKRLQGPQWQTCGPRGQIYSENKVKALSEAERGGQKSDKTSWPIALHLEGYVRVSRPLAGVSRYHLTNESVRYDPPLLPRGDRSPLCVSSSHPLVNLPEVFSRLGGRLEAETWLTLGWL